MGLQVWLPLNGNLNNQGLMDVTATNNGATIDNNGKIGKCYSFDGSDDFINLGSIGSFFDGSAFSICFWIYSLENTTRAAVFSSYGLSSTSNFFGLELNSSNGSYCNNNLRFDWLGSDTYSPADFITYNAWTHVCVTYDGINKINMYKNGELIQTSTRALNSITVGNNYYLGRDSRTGTTAFNGKLNDFRIYDHCLSPREVKEISKGLVLHYPLAMPGQENLLLNTATPVSWTTTYTNTDQWSVKDIYNMESPVNQLFAANDTATFSFDWEFTPGSSGSITGNFHLETGNVTPWILGSVSKSTGTRNNASNYIDLSATNTSGHVTCTFVVSSSAASAADTFRYFRIRWDKTPKDGTLKLSNCKLERGEIATPWIPNPADTVYSTLGFNDGIEYDVSGYNHNGIKAGTLTYDADTPRYNVCSALTHSTDRIQITRPPYSVGQYINQISISIWFKTDQSNGDGSNFFSLGQNNFIRARIPRNATSSIWTYLRYQSSVLATAKDVGKELTDNIWHHFVFVWNNGIQYFYLDGVLAATSDNSSTTTQLYYSLESTWMLGGYNATAEYFIGFLSDFRVYSTALSADDILELYHTPITLSNNGALLTQGEYVES